MEDMERGHAEQVFKQDFFCNYLTCYNGSNAQGTNVHVFWGYGLEINDCMCVTLLGDGWPKSSQ